MNTVVFRSRQRVRCQELWAVLDAAGIPGSIRDRGGICLLLVHEGDFERAVQELDDYRRELPREQQPEPELPTLGGGRLAILVYAFALVIVAGRADRSWFDAGRAQAELLLHGQWWRAITALTLHVDAQHLVGNLAFGSVLGFLAAQRLGGGVAWIGILIGGVLGNVANAWLQDPGHSSVGASTAVFAALGLLVTLALAHRRGRTETAVRRWSPLVAGILLLAWTGVGGERTDVSAHITGLAAGLLLGAIGGFIPLAVLERRAVQFAAAALALTLVGVAWTLALTRT